jgi:hypothetical protein
MNNGEDGSDSITIEPRRPAEDRVVLLISEFRNLTDFDFKNFNYFSFEQDVAGLTPKEFEWFYASHFEPWLFQVDEEYIDIDFDENYYKFNNQDEKKLFLLKMVNFVMFLLPYQILREVFKQDDVKGIESAHDIQGYLDDDMNLVALRGEIMEELDHNMTQFDSFVKTLLHFEKISKKNLVEENIELLDEHIKKQNFFLEIFKGIIRETDMHKMQNLVSRMVETDAANLL